MTDPAEGAVRLYLMYLEDPGKLVDETAVKKAEDAVKAAKDPLDRLQALAALDQARQADGEQLRKDFIAQASAYAEAQRIPASAFREMGVPGDVLVEAGLDGGRRRRRGSGASGRARAPRVPLEDIKAAASRVSKRFTLAQLADAAGGGSPATLRKAVDELIAEGKATKLGPKEDHQGRGRAPTVYQKS